MTDSRALTQAQDQALSEQEVARTGATRSDIAN
ncbi:MAG: hypothetical protein JWN69_1171, partial [Alphaproteobacteria bacterium]|nr:hypothetical protein [Alphaproteobacteria bacterium]